tara:strand:+ start:1491 stop:1688 length:198 start_codon:yes stop_codon:yes gene_type:complete
MEEVSPAPDGWITLKEAEKTFKLGRKKILSGIHESKFPAIMGYFDHHMTQSWRIDPEGLRAWISQ